MRTKKITIWIISIVVAIAAITAAIAGYGYYLVMLDKVEVEENAYIHIIPEDNSTTVMQKITNITGKKSVKGFELLAKHNRYDNRKRSGRFVIKNGDSMHSIYRRIVCNEQSPVKLTVPATRDIQQMIGAISRQLMLDSAELAEFTRHPLYISKIGYTKETLPSLFIPDTYEVYWNIKPEKLMIRFMEEKRKFWNESRKAKAKAIGLTPEEVATLASIVDEETNNEAEKPVVAGLYINRLKRGIPLQADPTIKYALGDPTRRRILNEDLKVESPYNTYKNKGLPPGPIRIATRQALESVLDYSRHNYIYMCAKEDFSGTHNFAVTLSEHNANARKYQNALNRLKINK